MALNRKVFLLVVIVLASSLACGLLGDLTDSNAESLPAEGDSLPGGGKDNSAGIDIDTSLEGTSLGQVLSSGAVALDGIEANEDGETSGQILTVRLTNPGTEEILLEFPCGLVFIPTSSEDQPLMLVQPLGVALPAGATEEVTPYVVCVDIGATAPALATTYSVGYITGDEDLLALAECVCQEDLSAVLDDFEIVGVQFAAWTIQTGTDFKELMESGEGAAGDLLGSEEFVGMADLVLELMTELGGEWLEQCGIEVE